MTEDKQSMFSSMDNKANLQRPSDLPKFIMDKITKCAKEVRDRRLGEVEEVFDSAPTFVVDADLTEPWLDAVKLADRFVEEEGNDRMKRDLEKITEHVHIVYQRHRAEMAQVPLSPKKERRNAAGGGGGGGGGGGATAVANVAQFSDLPIEVRQDNLRALSNEFISKPRMEDVMMDEDEIRRLRASYAYLYDSRRRGKWTRFPWDVGTRELCAIKGM
jgi:RNA-dependent RNA polymerase